MYCYEKCVFHSYSTFCRCMLNPLDLWGNLPLKFVNFCVDNLSVDESGILKYSSIIAYGTFCAFIYSSVYFNEIGYTNVQFMFINYYYFWGLGWPLRIEPSALYLLCKCSTTRVMTLAFCFYYRFSLTVWAGLELKILLCLPPI
jgi:hypothetical protein